MVPAKTELYLSPADLAQSLGLSVSTLKRWTDKGVLRVERTPGGHRRIAVSEALRFVRESGLKPVMPHRLGLPELGGPSPGADPAAQVAELLLAGRGDDVRRLLVSAFVRGEDIVKIGDLWLRPGFERLGELWNHDPQGIAIEHHGTEAVVRALAEMRARVEPPEGAPVAIGGSVAGDPYLIPTALAGLVLSVAGFASTNLGADLPRAALAAILDSFRPRLVWLSVSVRDLEEGRRAALEDVAATVSERGGTLLVGGRAAPDRVKGATVCRDLATLDAFARGLLA